MAAAFRHRTAAHAALLVVLLATATPSARAADLDLDGVADELDNCPAWSNPGQVDTDLDGFGNDCDADYNNDLLVGLADMAALKYAFGSQAGDPAYQAVMDADSDGTIGLYDLSRLRDQIFGPPGPSIAQLQNTFYVDPVLGDDFTTGAIDRPWRTLQAAMNRLGPGSTLYLRGGTYAESKVYVGARGADGDPAVIRSYPGESAVIDGGFPEFRVPGNSDWELVDATRNIYRSVLTYPGIGQAHGYLEYGGTLYHLVPYESYADLASDNQYYTETGPIYVGHGIYWNPTDLRIYVRLVPSDLQLFLGANDPPALDPRQVAIYAFSGSEVLSFTGSSAYLVLEGIDIRYQNNAIEFLGGAHDITVRDADVLGGRTHVLVRSGGHDLVFDDLRIRDSVPPWIAWEDVKSGSEPAHDFQGAAFNIQGNAYGIEIANCLVTDIFDAIDATDSPHDLNIHDNTFQRIRDDVLQLGTAGYNTEIHHNRMTEVSKGVSRNGSGDTPYPGTTWVHHNVIDASVLMQYGRQNPDGTWHGKADPGMNGQVWAAPFGSHTVELGGAGQAWKIYHNTVFVGKEVGNNGAGHARFTRPGYVTEVYNNIFVQVADHRITRNATADGAMQIYDGNLYYRVGAPTDPLFKDFTLVTGGTGQDFTDLASFIGSSFWLATQSFYAPGWDTNAVEADPLLDAQYQPASGGPAASGAVPLPPGFPGDLGETFRGALPPVGP